MAIVVSLSPVLQCAFNQRNAVKSLLAGSDFTVLPSV